MLFQEGSKGSRGNGEYQLNIMDQTAKKKGKREHNSHMDDATRTRNTGEKGVDRVALLIRQKDALKKQNRQAFQGICAGRSREGGCCYWDWRYKKAESQSRGPDSRGGMETGQTGRGGVRTNSFVSNAMEGTRNRKLK